MPVGDSLKIGLRPLSHSDHALGVCVCQGSTVLVGSIIRDSVAAFDR